MFENCHFSLGLKSNEINARNKKPWLRETDMEHATTDEDRKKRKIFRAIILFLPIQTISAV
jgi:hypothetical protein